MNRVLLFLFAIGFACAAGEVPKTSAKESRWQTKLRHELARAEKMGLTHGPYDVSASSIWIPVTTSMSEIFDSVGKAEVASFLRAVQDDSRNPVSIQMRRYLNYCLSGTKSSWHSEPTSYRQGEEKVVFLLAPLDDFFGRKAKPIQSGEPTPDTVH